MCQYLNAGNQLHALGQSISVQLLQLFLCIAAAHIAEIGIVVHFPSILGVEHQAVVAHISGQVDPLLYAVYCGNGIAGAIQHSAEFAELQLIIHRNTILYYFRNSIISPGGFECNPFFSIQLNY